ncbi:MAG TPA: site-2 protease family protein, partial [Candidatus Acidoferrum sp.]|nr:site-2 protease family protein [Candidatus Acidoferrum sp.]
RILGIPIYLDFSWVLIFGLVTVSLALQFGQKFSNWGTTEQWGLGVLTSLLFFGSVVFHELAHSAVAQHYKINVLSITLFLFGGLARIGREPSKAIQEFNIAIAGPVASGLLALLFYGLGVAFPKSEMVSAMTEPLILANGMLAGFNLLPGFPLDGGRMFRAAVWGATKDFARATRVAAMSGKLIAYVMIGLGIFSALTGDKGGPLLGYIGRWNGIWLAFIGWFLLSAAQASMSQLTIRETLTGLCAADVMSHEVPTIPGNLSLEEYGAEVLRTGRRIHIVTMDDRLVGLMNVAALNRVPRDEWSMNSVQAVMVPRDKILWASPEEPLQRLLERLMSADVNQMPVVRHGEDGAAHIIGMVTRDAILRVIQTRSELSAALNGK